jgi:mRNA interferase HigB
VRILGRLDLIAQSAIYGDCTKQVERWCSAAEVATWRNLTDVRKTFSSADVVGDQFVFNIRGNRYRLIVSINFKLGIIAYEALLTHAEYDKGKWKH